MIVFSFPSRAVPPNTNTLALFYSITWVVIESPAPATPHHAAFEFFTTVTTPGILVLTLGANIYTKDQVQKK